MTHPRDSLGINLPGLSMVVIAVVLVLAFLFGWNVTS